MGKGMWAKFFAHIGKGENAAGWRETDPRVPVDENGVAVCGHEHSGSVPLCPLALFHLIGAFFDLKVQSVALQSIK